MNEPLDWELITGRNNPKERYRIYRRRVSDDDPYLLATCETEADVGVAICEMAREGQFDDAAVGILDRLGEKGKRWLVLPWLPKSHA